MRIRLVILVLALISIPAYAQFSKNTISSQISTQFPDQTTGQITPATTRAFLANLLNSYQQYAGINSQAGAAYTVQNSDYGQIIKFSGGNVAVTLSPANATGFSTFNFYAQNITTGNVVITPQGGTICGASVLTLANTQVSWIVSDGTNWQCLFSSSSLIENPLAVSHGGTGGSVPSGTLLDNISGFSSLGILARTASNTYQFLSYVGGITPANITLSNLTTLCNPTNTNSNPVACNPGQMSAVLCTPTRTNFTATGGGTYTTATCNGVRATWLEVDLQGGGGGGAGSGTTNPAGTAGNNSTFGALTAGGGAAGSGVTPGGGGTCSGTLGTQQNFTGASGNGTNINAASAAPGGAGGPSYYGGAGIAGKNGADGGTALASTGAGGGGGGGNATAGVIAGVGGGAGCHIRSLIQSPAASISFTVGAAAGGGIAGASGNAGGGGASGFLEITAHWQ